tara:strand:- start:18444 stop:18854 length:411 start_codon:yes stop_codon:yes gene_type:complete
MDDIDQIANRVAVDVPSTTLKLNNTKQELTVEQIIEFFTGEDSEKKTQMITGRVYQKNKKLKFFETFFKLVEEEIVKLESKNNKDLDNSFFNLNKKLLSTNIYNIKEIINLYGIDQDRLVTFLIGTVIQSMYDKKD